MRTSSIRRLLLAVFTALVLAAPAGSALSGASAGGLVAPTAVCDDLGCY